MNISIKSFLLLVIATLVAVNTVDATTFSGSLSAGVGAPSSFSGTVISLPVANPSSGSYSSTQNVSLSANDSTSIRYTVDGSQPTCSSGSTYSTPIVVSQTLTLKAVSCYPGGVQSPVVSFSYEIKSQNTTSSSGGGSVLSSGSGGSVSYQKGDANKDGKVNILDFVILMANWGQTDLGNKADFNNDSKVDILDFVILMANWTN
jgi:hypothetical protein